MKSLSIDTLYLEIDKLILLVQSYTEIKGLYDIFKACRLKPVSYVCEGKSHKLVLHKWWFDEFGNSVKINNKNIDVEFNDLNINRQKIICTDIYHGLSLKKISKISTKAHIIFAKDNVTLITFVGMDGYLRTYINCGDEWEQISPLYIGIKILLKIFNNEESNFKINWGTDFPCDMEDQWLTCLPINNDFRLLLGEQFEHVNFLNMED